MIIRKQQMVAMHELRIKGIANRIVPTIKLRYPAKAAKIAMEAFTPTIEDAIYLGMREDDQIYRFVRLMLLPDKLLQSPLIQSTLTLTLNRTEWPAEKRLAFIELQIGARSSLLGGPDLMDRL